MTDTQPTSEDQPTTETKTRREVLFRNAKAIATVAMAATVANLAGIGRARALGGGGGHSPCFLDGTGIRTADGERPIETLRPGDLVFTRLGGLRPIEWVWHKRHTRRDPSRPWSKHLQLVRIASSAIADGVPNRDLYMTPGHAVLIDGSLVVARDLVNGRSITWYAPEDRDHIDIYNILLASHDVIEAAGLPCETLLEFEETVGDDQEFSEIAGDHLNCMEPCAPTFHKGALAEIRERLPHVLAPWRGPHKVDIIHDRLAARSAAL